MVRRRVTVHGRVQGVWFRDGTARLARAEGVAGWVRNRADGSVEAVLEGSSGAVEAVIDYCGSGPPSATVERVEVTDEEPEGLRGFRIA